jgi:hypothetical protein
MCSRARLVLASVAALGVVSAAAAQTLVWSDRSTHLTNAGDVPVDAAVDQAGNVYLALDSSGPPTWHLVKLAPGGEIAWQIDESDAWPNCRPSPRDFTVDAFGDVLVLGYGAPGVPGVALQKRGIDGSLQWATSIDLQDSNWSALRQVESNANGEAFVLGVFSNSSDWFRIVPTIQKFTPAGERLWAIAYLGDFDDASQVTGIAPTLDGGVILVAGYAGAGGAYDVDILAVKFRADGEREWIARFEPSCAPPLSTATWPKSFATYPTGEIVIAGWSTCAEDGDLGLVKYDADGHEEWNYVDDDGVNHEAIDVTIAPDGSVVVLAREYNDPQRMTLFRFGAQGELLFRRSYQRLGSQLEFPVQVAVLPDQTILATIGLARTASEPPRMLMRAFDGLGEPLWSNSYTDSDFSSNTPLPIMQLTPTGNAMVTFGIYGDVNPDSVTQMYQADGTLDWETHVGTQADAEEYPWNVIATPDGGAVVYEGRSGQQVILRKYSLDGTIDWQRSDSRNFGYAIATETDDAGGLYRFAPPSNLERVRPDGSLDWSVPVEYPAGDPNPRAVVAEPGGGATVLGLAYNLTYCLSDLRAFVAQFDAAGQLRWRLPFQGREWPNLLTRDSEGGFAIAGDHCASNFHRGIFLKRIAPDGSERWTRRTTGASWTGENPHAVVCDDLGSTYVIGSAVTQINGATNLLLQKYDTGGTLLWQRLWQPAPSLGNRMFGAIDNDGHIFVGTNIVDRQQGFDLRDDFALARYTPDGERQWELRWDNPWGQADELTGLVVDRHGTAIAMARSDGPDFRRLAALVAVSRTGQVIWSSLRGSGATEHCDYQSVAVRPDNYLVCVASAISFCDLRDTVVRTFSSVPAPCAGTPTCRPADIDGDCAITLQDLVIVLANFGTSIREGEWPTNGDLDNDTIVSLTDLQIVLNSFGVSCR